MFHATKMHGDVWHTYERSKLVSQTVVHPGYNSAKANEWAQILVNKAKDLTALKFNRVNFFYHVKVPSNDKREHDLFRCHPNFRGDKHTGERQPWHDWAMVEFVEDDGSVSKVANKILLWAQFSNTNAAPLDNGDDDSVTVGSHDQTPVYIYAAVQPLAHNDPPVDEILRFGRMDKLHELLWVVEFDTIAETAFVLLLVNHASVKRFQHDESSKSVRPFLSV